MRIRELLAATRGNVTRTAAKLGITKNSLYKRLAVLGVDPAAFRPKWLERHHRHPQVPRASAASAVTGDAQKRAVAIFPSAADSPSVAAVQASMVRSPTRRSTLRFRPDHLAAIGRARRKLSALLDVELTNSALLERFIDDKLADWLAEQTRSRLPPNTTSEGTTP